MRVPWIIGNWSSGPEDNSRFLGWLSTVAVETTTTKIETTGDRPDDRARRRRSRERKREGEVEGIRCFELSVNIDGGWVGGGSAKRSCKRDARAIGRVDHHQDDISIAPLIYSPAARCPPAAYRITRWCNCHRVRRIARMARLDESKRGELERRLEI